MWGLKTVYQCKKKQTMQRRETSLLQAKESTIQELNEEALHKQALQRTVDAFASHSASLKQMRQERLDAETAAEQYRLQYKSTNTKLQQALRRFLLCMFVCVCVLSTCI